MDWDVKREKARRLSRFTFQTMNSRKLKIMLYWTSCTSIIPNRSCHVVCSCGGS